ncbi:hypothetical protein OPKNFCMD_0714 [Methylobacterium crusticola]|uniref:DUF2285 domain-containing protein n=1 Tax=Methylobacterium crusticola TaxID=1697972 RepID=A0ABQ4QRR1_9HYPH|nr:hypothetical protein [Methylobacterium crusticola]GJD48000.1 hypothetical protein OPKNFCMD_0714 [Methylobacterium crusticola]
MLNASSASTLNRTFGPDQPCYRAYLVDHDDRLVWAELINANDDRDAVRFALTMVENHAIELWDRGRFVIRLDAPARRPLA